MQGSGLSRAIETATRDMHAGGEASSPLAMRTLLERCLRAMACDGQRGQAVELLRRVLGDERAAIVATAVLPETEETPKSPDRPCRLCLAMRHAGFRAAGLAVGMRCVSCRIYFQARSLALFGIVSCVCRIAKTPMVDAVLHYPISCKQELAERAGVRPVRGNLSVTVGKIDAAMVAAQRFDGKGSFAPEYPGIFTAKR